MRTATVSALLITSLAAGLLLACQSGDTTASPTPTQTTRPDAASPTATPQTDITRLPDASTVTPAGEFKIAIGRHIMPNGTPHANRAPRSLHRDFGVTEYLFEAHLDDRMYPVLATSWELDNAASKLSISLREGVPWNPPFGYEHLDFGHLTADDVARVINLNNLPLNPENFPLAPVGLFFGEARPTGEYQLEISLKQQFAFPDVLIDGGMPGSAVDIYAVKTIENMGVDWALENPVGTGPFVQGKCTETGCNYHAVESNWRSVPEIATLTTIAIDDWSTWGPMVANGVVDAATIPAHGAMPELEKDGVRFIHALPGFTGQSVLWSGNYWEESHAVTGEPLEPWDLPAFDKDYPWIGDPWQQLAPELVRYEDTDNPPGMTDMEQARLVRLAFDVAVDRQGIIDEHFAGYGGPLYSEYMGPNYGGWDPDRSSLVWTFTGEVVEPSGTSQPVPWQLNDNNLEEADRLLTLAGYPLVDGTRPEFGEFSLLHYGVAELGSGNVHLAPFLVETWSKLGIPIVEVFDNYSLISPGLRSRDQVLPLLKNGDVESSNYPVDGPYPATDTSLSRGGGLNFGFESPYLANQFLAINASLDRDFRVFQHLSTADYMIYWRLYGGLIQVPKGVMVNERVEEWSDPYSSQQQVGRYPRPQFIRLKSIQ